MSKVSHGQLTLADFHNVKDIGRMPERDWSWAFFHCMTQEDRDEFDRALVRYEHPLAYQPGSTWDRFCAYLRESNR